MERKKTYFWLCFKRDYKYLHPSYYYHYYHLLTIVNTVFVPINIIATLNTLLILQSLFLIKNKRDPHILFKGTTMEKSSTAFLRNLCHHTSWLFLIIESFRFISAIYLEVKYCNYMSFTLIMYLFLLWWQN